MIFGRWTLNSNPFTYMCYGFNPRHMCRRVTVVVMCVCVCLSVTSLAVMFLVHMSQVRFHRVVYENFQQFSRVLCWKCFVQNFWYDFFYHHCHPACFMTCSRWSKENSYRDSFQQDYIVGRDSNSSNWLVTYLTKQSIFLESFLAFTTHCVSTDLAHGTMPGTRQSQKLEVKDKCPDMPGFSPARYWGRAGWAWFGWSLWPHQSIPFPHQS